MASGPNTQLCSAPDPGSRKALPELRGRGARKPPGPRRSRHCPSRALFGHLPFSHIQQGLDQGPPVASKTSTYGNGAQVLQGRGQRENGLHSDLERRELGKEQARNKDKTTKTRERAGRWENRTSASPPRPGLSPVGWTLLKPTLHLLKGRRRDLNFKKLYSTAVWLICNVKCAAE